MWANMRKLLILYGQNAFSVTNASFRTLTRAQRLLKFKSSPPQDGSNKLTKYHRDRERSKKVTKLGTMDVFRSTSQAKALLKPSTAAFCLSLSPQSQGIMLYELGKKGNKNKIAKTTAPRIPAWSPTVVLTRRHSG